MLYYHDTNLAVKDVMKAKIVSKFLGTAKVWNLRSTELREALDKFCPSSQDWFEGFYFTKDWIEKC
jgi:hypothetical protein